MDGDRCGYRRCQVAVVDEEMKEDEMDVQKGMAMKRGGSTRIGELDRDRRSLTLLRSPTLSSGKSTYYSGTV